MASLSSSGRRGQGWKVRGVSGEARGVHVDGGVANKVDAP